MRVSLLIEIVDENMVLSSPFCDVNLKTNVVRSDISREFLFSVSLSGSKSVHPFGFTLFRSVI